MWLIHRVLCLCWLWWFCLQLLIIGSQTFVECSKEIISNTVTEGLETSGCSPIGIMVKIPTVTAETHDQENTITEKELNTDLNKMFPTPVMSKSSNEAQIPSPLSSSPSSLSHDIHNSENQNDNGIISVKLTKSQNKNLPKKHESGLFQEIYIKSNSGMKNNGQNPNNDYKNVQDLRILIENDGVKTSIKPLKESHKFIDDNTKQNDKRILSKNQELLKVLNTLLKRKQKLSENKLLNLDSDYSSDEYYDDDHDNYKRINSKENENFRHILKEDIQGRRNKNLHRNFGKGGSYTSVERNYVSKETSDCKDKKIGHTDSYNLNLNLARYIKQEMKKLQKIEAECRLEEQIAAMRSVKSPVSLKPKYSRDFDNYPMHSKKHSTSNISGEKLKNDKKFINSRDSCFDDHNDPAAIPCENGSNNEKNLSPSLSYYEHASHPYLEYGSEYHKFDKTNSRRNSSGKQNKSKGIKNWNIEESEENYDEYEEEEDNKLKKNFISKSKKNQNKNNSRSGKNKKWTKEENKLSGRKEDDYQDYEDEDQEKNKKHDTLDDKNIADEIDVKFSEENDYSEEESKEDVMKRGRSYGTRQSIKKRKQDKKDKNKENENEEMEEEKDKEPNKYSRKKSRFGYKEKKRWNDKSQEDSQEKNTERNRNKHKGSKRYRNKQKKYEYEDENEHEEDEEYSDKIENKKSKRKGDRHGNERNLSEEINDSSEEEKPKNIGKRNRGGNKVENGRSRKQRRQANLNHLKKDSYKDKMNEGNEHLKGENYKMEHKINERTKRAVIYSVEKPEWVQKTIPTQQSSIEWGNTHPQVITSTGDIIEPHAEINYATHSHSLPSSNEQIHYPVNNPQQLNWHEVKRLLKQNDNQQVRKVPGFSDDLSRKIYKLLKCKNREHILRPVESEEEYSGSSEEINYKPIYRYASYAKPATSENFRLNNYLKNLKSEPKEVVENRSVEHLIPENGNPRYFEGTNENQEPSTTISSSSEDKKDVINPKDCIKFKPIKRGRFRIPLKLVEDEKGNYFLEIDVKYFCRSCNKKRSKIKDIKLESSENRN